MNRPLSDELSIVSLNEIYSFMLENVQAPCNSGKNVTEFFMVNFCPHKLPFLLCVLQSFKKKNSVPYYVISILFQHWKKNLHGVGFTLKPFSH